jgi:hypothetical protein
MSCCSGQRRLNTVFEQDGCVNIGTLTILSLVGKRLLPAVVRDATPGAGFHVAARAFFTITTYVLW